MSLIVDWCEAPALIPCRGLLLLFLQKGLTYRSPRGPLLRDRVGKLQATSSSALLRLPLQTGLEPGKRCPVDVLQPDPAALHGVRQPGQCLPIATVADEDVQQAAQRDALELIAFWIWSESPNQTHRSLERYLCSAGDSGPAEEIHQSSDHVCVLSRPSIHEKEREGTGETSTSLRNFFPCLKGRSSSPGCLANLLEHDLWAVLHVSLPERRSTEKDVEVPHCYRHQLPACFPLTGRASR